MIKNQYISNGLVNVSHESNLVIGNKDSDWTNVSTGCILAIAGNNLSYHVAKAMTTDFLIPFVAISDEESLTIDIKLLDKFHIEDAIKIEFDDQICRRTVMSIDRAKNGKANLSIESPLDMSRSRAKIEGKVILTKWTLILSEPYMGDSRSDCEYGISTGATSNLGLPIIHIQESPLCPIFNRAMTIIDDAFKKLENQPKSTKVEQNSTKTSSSYGIFEFFSENADGKHIINRRAPFDYKIHEIYARCDGGNCRIRFFVGDDEQETPLIASEQGYETKLINPCVSKGCSLQISAENLTNAKNLYLSIVYETV